MKIFEVTLVNELAVDARFATRAETQALAQRLQAQMPEYNFKVEKKAISPVTYVRIFGADKADILNYFKQFNLDSLPLEPEQAGISGKYRSNILSFQTGATPVQPNPEAEADPEVDSVIYTLVVASRGKTDQGGVSVSIKEFTPTALGLAGGKYTKEELVAATQNAVTQKASKRPELLAILLGLLDIAANGGQGTLSPEVNQNLSDGAKGQLSVDFGEILAPIMFAQDGQLIEFPDEGNFPLVDVVVGGTKYSVKSLTGSGTSFRSISNLMDNFEETIAGDDSQEKLFSLFKTYHPKAGGKNVDKIIAGANYLGVPEYKKVAEILGGTFTDYAELKNLVAAQPFAKKPNDKGYTEFLKTFYPAMTAGNWDNPTGLPADGRYFLGLKKSDGIPVEKEAGLPSFRANPVKAATDILTYVVGIATLNQVSRGPDADEYAKMMTNIVNQSEAYLGRLDITNEGGLTSATRPFAKLKFKFQYHAPSNKPGNNLPGFMVVY